MQSVKQLKKIISEVKILVKAMKAGQLDNEGAQNLHFSIRGINGVLYHSEFLRFQKSYDLSKEEEYFSCINEIEILIKLWEQTLARRSEKEIDGEFWDIYEYFKYVDIDIIYQTVTEHFKSLPEWQRMEYLSLPNRYTWMQGKLDFINRDYSLIEQHVELMANKIENYRWLYERLADYRSKMILNGIIRYWFEFDINKLHTFTETVFKDYYDLDILECGKDDVLVDLGAFVGDSICDYIKTYGLYKRIYAYEITPSTYQELIRNISQYPDIVTRQKGVGSEKSTMFMMNDKIEAGNHLSEAGDVRIDVVTLDEDIKEPISVIKMDIEGLEKDAIMGAKGHILSEKPKLLVSSYHLPGDIFDIPYLIHSIRDDYKFYMRFNGRGLWPCDYVLIAV